MNEEIKTKAKAAWDRSLLRTNLKQRFQDQLNFAYSGGMWRADRETIAFLSAFNNREHLVVEDIYGVPRTINPTELLEQCIERYQYAANTWSAEYHQFSQTRRASDV
jgi:hypothetical protein